MSALESCIPFQCPECVRRDNGGSTWYFTGQTVDGVKYCALCAGEILDEVVTKAYDRLVKGPLSWEGHEVRIRVSQGVYYLHLKCTDIPGGKVDEISCDPNVFWDALAAFVNEHHVAMKKLVMGVPMQP